MHHEALEANLNIFKFKLKVPSGKSMENYGKCQFMIDNYGLHHNAIHGKTHELSMAISRVPQLRPPVNPAPRRPTFECSGVMS